jgi:hypothetical protein
VLRRQDVEHARDLERAEWNRRWAEEERVRAEAERIRQQEQERREKLEVAAESWAKAQRIRAYVDAVERAGVGSCESAEWILWARDHANRLDPILNPTGAAGEEDTDC